jgi:hypothetical protein
MTTSLAIQNGISPGELMERVIAAGDISKMEPEDRARYVVRVCESAGLNPLTKPFDLITLNGKLTLYATKGATDQLRKIHGVTLRIVSKERIDDVYMVTVEATTPEGRTDTDIGVVTLGSLKGDALANALMKALTKAKRRVTLSICGLGLLDESEFDTMPPRVFQGGTEDDAPPQPSRPATAPERAHTGTPVTAEVVDADSETGEMPFNPETATQKQITAEITRLRSALGWTETDLTDFAAAHKIGRDRAEALRMVSALQEMLDREYGDDEEDEPEQPPLLDADVKPIDRWA